METVEIQRLIGAFVVGLGSMIGYDIWKGRPKLIAYAPKSMAFQTTFTKTADPVTIITDWFLLENVGKQPVTDVVVVLQGEPAEVKMEPEIEWTPELRGDGRYLMKIPHIPPGGGVQISLLNSPALDSIRYKEGVVDFPKVILQRHYPKWYRLALAGLVVLGLIYLAQLIAHYLL